MRIKILCRKGKMYMETRDVSCSKLSDGLFFVRIAGQPVMANPYARSKRSAELWFGSTDGIQTVDVVTYTDPKSITPVDIHTIHFIPETSDEEDLIFAEISNKNAWFEGFLIDRNKIDTSESKQCKSTIRRQPYKKLKKAKNT